MSILSYFLKNKDKYSQSGQDQFAYNLIGHNGTYLEIGANDPLINSNTYRLEVLCGWKGVSVELDVKYKKNWQKCKQRKNKVIWDDAFNLDYIEVLQNNNLPNRINYLSCDIEPPINTLNILKKIISQNIVFDFISFEHDRYVEGEYYDLLSKDFMHKNNYKVAIENVFSRNKRNKIYETWFVHHDILFEKIDYLKWKNYNYKNNFKI